LNIGIRAQHGPLELEEDARNAVGKWKACLQLSTPSLARGTRIDSPALQQQRCGRSALVVPAQAGSTSVASAAVLVLLLESMQSSWRMEALGITTAASIDIDTLEARLRQEALDTHGFAVISVMIGAFARKP